MNEFNWKVLGWKITTKLVFYAIMVLIFTGGFTGACALMTTPNTLSFASGLILSVIVLGMIVSFIMREISFYSKVLNADNKTKQNETNN